MIIEVVQKKFAEIDELNRRLRWWKIGATVSCGVIILTGLFVLRSAALDLINKGPQQEEFVAELAGGFRREVVPEVTTLTMGTLDKLMPVVKTELGQLQARTPELTAKAAQELETLRQEMPARIHETLQESLGKVIAEREAKIRQMFPEMTDAAVARLVANLTRETEARLLNIGSSIMNPYVASMQGIFNDIHLIRELEAETVKNRPVTWEVAVLCANLLQENLREMAPVEYARFMQETSLGKENQ
ncbi:MAG: hypothetical protein PCFJNLEI_03814 [Verrucomicrobiae bacterium]|nr:hypothetical protein [Verrucomicrobiae bacterium]